MLPIHSLRIPFRLELGPGKTLDRFAYVYLVLGQRIVLVDCGVAGAEKVIVDHLHAIGRAPKDLTLVVLTHAHPDHIGGLRGLKNTLEVSVAAHADAIPWIEDVALQYQERPVPSFHVLVGGSVPVDLPLQDQSLVDLGEGRFFRVLHTPGHAAGHIALLDQDSGVLLSGDAIPVPATLPIYDDPLVLLQSLQRLRAIDGLRRLCSSWEEPQEGNVYARIDAGIAYLRQIHRTVLELQTAHSMTDSTRLTESVLAKLGLPLGAINPLLVHTIDAHCRRGDAEELKS